MWNITIVDDSMRKRFSKETRCRLCQQLWVGCLSTFLQVLSDGLLLQLSSREVIQFRSPSAGTDGGLDTDCGMFDVTTA